MAQLTKAQRDQVAALVRALHAANSGGVRGNPYLAHREALKGASELLTGASVDAFGPDSPGWADVVGPNCEAAP